MAEESEVKNVLDSLFIEEDKCCINCVKYAKAAGFWEVYAKAKREEINRLTKKQR